jgi:penicillin-insensitive murein DD-endopeptidase
MAVYLKFLVLFFWLLSHPAWTAESTCYGTTANGRLDNGVPLPRSGANFVVYSDVARIAGRTYVHSAVRDIIVDAYEALEQEHPAKQFKYAETGFKSGGAFKPHKTHRNGLSVDFMTPVKNAQGESVHLPTHPGNSFGYDSEFDKAGHYENLTIDYLALAAHLVALDKAAKARGHSIKRVIFDPALQAGLFRTPYANYLRRYIVLSQRPSWVRHDEHYHVDFAIPCKK